MDSCPGYEHTQAIQNCPWLAAVNAEISALKDGRDELRTSLSEVERKLDRLIFWMIAATTSFTGALILGLVNVLAKKL